MSRSLGTLTLDLIARVGGFVQGMDKAERSSAKWRKQVENDAKKVGMSIGVGSVAAVAGLTAITVAEVNLAKEISRFSSVSNAATDEFQRYAIAADTVGISHEKLSDQLKDFNEKVGEFRQSGGGGMKDFFEQIAPKIGITADAFRDLSGPQALQLYYDSLEKAGLNQQQMSFYLESMASDTTALIPLLRDGGMGFKLLGDEAARAGAIMDDKTIRAANELSAAAMLANLALDGVRNQIVSGLLPTLSDLSSAFSDTSTDGEDFMVIGEAVGSTLKFIATTAIGSVAAIHLTGKAIAELLAVGAAATEGSRWYDAILPISGMNRLRKNLSGIKNQIDITQDDINVTIQKYASALDKIWAAGDGGNTNDRVKQIADIIAETRKALSSSVGVSESNNDVIKQIESQIKALELEAKTFSMAEYAARLYRLENTKGITGPQIDRAKAALESIKQQEALKTAAEDYKALVGDLRNDEEKLTDQLRERLAILDAIKDISNEERSMVAGRIVDEGFTDAPDYSGLAPEVGGAFGELNKIDEAKAELEDWYSTQLEMLQTFREERADLAAIWDEQELELAEEHQERLLKIEQARQRAQLVAAKSVFGDITDVMKEFAGEQSGIYKAMFAVHKAAAIAEAMVAIQQGIAMAVANPFPMNLAAVATVMSATSSLVSNIQAIGMAHDGIDKVPQDGTWLLQKGERVTTAETSAKLDSTLDRIQQALSKQPGSMRGGSTSISVPIGNIDGGNKQLIANLPGMIEDTVLEALRKYA